MIRSNAQFRKINTQKSRLRGLTGAPCYCINCDDEESPKICQQVVLYRPLSRYCWSSVIWPILGHAQTVRSYAHLGGSPLFWNRARLQVSGAIWVNLYLEQPSGTFCFFCGYDMQVHASQEPTCPECGKSCTSEYRQTGWRDTAKQVPGCLLFLLGALFLLIGGLLIFFIKNGVFI